LIAHAFWGELMQLMNVESSNVWVSAQGSWFSPRHLRAVQFCLRNSHTLPRTLLLVKLQTNWVSFVLFTCSKM
jgi:hypothetical protein